MKVKGAYKPGSLLAARLTVILPSSLPSKLHSTQGREPSPQVPGMSHDHSQLVVPISCSHDGLGLSMEPRPGQNNLRESLLEALEKYLFPNKQ